MRHGSSASGTGMREAQSTTAVALTQPDFPPLLPCRQTLLCDVPSYLSSSDPAAASSASVLLYAIRQVRCGGIGCRSCAGDEPCCDLHDGGPAARVPILITHPLPSRPPSLGQHCRILCRLPGCGAESIVEVSAQVCGWGRAHGVARCAWRGALRLACTRRRPVLHSLWRGRVCWL